MKQYNLRRLRLYLFSLYDISKDCVQTCKNLEILTNVSASTLYDVLNFVILNDSNNLTSNFLSLVLKCIIVHNEDNGNDSRNFYNQFSNTPPSDTSDTCIGQSNEPRLIVMKSPSFRQSDNFGGTHYYIFNPSIFFKSNLGEAIIQLCGSSRIQEILYNRRVLIPTAIFELSQSSLFTFIQSLDPSDPLYKSLLKITKLILKRRYIPKQGDHLNSHSRIYVQCSGDILYHNCVNSFDGNKINKKEKGKKKMQLKWSKMIIYKKLVYFNGKKNPKSRIYKTILESIDNDTNSVWSLFTFIMFKNQYFSENLTRRKESFDNFFRNEKMDNKNNKNFKIPKRKSLLNSLFIHFQNFINKIHDVDWNDTSLLKSNLLPETNLSTVSVEDVYLYIKSIMDQTIDYDLICGKTNYKRFLKVCNTLISLNKGETLSMSEVMKGININDCTWTTTKSKSNSKSNSISKYHSMGQTRTIQNYLCRIIFFLLQYFIIPVIGKHLHFTECGFTMYRIHYIMKKDWVRMIRVARNEYISNGVIQNMDESMPIQVFPEVKFVPKQFGMRPILNCNTTMGCDEFRDKLFYSIGHSDIELCRCYYCYIKKKKINDVTLNSMLKLIHNALMVNTKVCPILGNGVLGYSLFYRHLKSWWSSFISSLRYINNTNTTNRNDINHNNSNQNVNVNLYYFIADLSKCYERIPHDKLMEVLRGVKLVDTTFFHIYKRYFSKLASKVNSSGKTEDLVTYACKKMNNISCRTYGNSIIASRFDPNRSIKVSKLDIISAVEALISTQNIKLPNYDPDKYIKLNRGIPQGCCISPVLSSIYLASLDNKIADLRRSSFNISNQNQNKVQNLYQSPNQNISVPNFMVRWIDDFLFVTTNPEDVKKLSKIFCSDNFGAVMNPKKFISNVDNLMNVNDNNHNSSNSSYTNCTSYNSNGYIGINNSNGHYNHNLNHYYKHNGNYTIDEQCHNSNNTTTLEWINSRLNFDIKNKYINVELIPSISSQVKIRDTIRMTRYQSQSFMFSLIEQRLVGYITNKLAHKTYTCNKINSPDCILSNSYILMRTCSLKLLCSMIVLVEDFRGFINFKYFMKLIMNLVKITSNLVSRGGINPKKYKLREILMIAIINTFRLPKLNKNCINVKYKNKINDNKNKKTNNYNNNMNININKNKSNLIYKFLLLFNKKVISKLYHHVKSLPNEDALFHFASSIEHKHTKYWSYTL